MSKLININELRTTICCTADALENVTVNMRETVRALRQNAASIKEGQQDDALWRVYDAAKDYVFIDGSSDYADDDLLQAKNDLHNAVSKLSNEISATYSA
jgi:hypothetical protein